ncbi:MAG: hypothetical protein ABR941_08615 [Thermoleophilia bacterium]
MSADDTRDDALDSDDDRARDRLAIWARLLAVDVAVGLLWALLLVAAVLFVSGVSQFIYIAF